MTEEPLPSSKNQWLWFLMFGAMAALIVIWLVNTWYVESDVKTGASAEGVTFPANPGLELSAPQAGEAEAEGEAAKTE